MERREGQYKRSREDGGPEHHDHDRRQKRGYEIDRKIRRREEGRDYYPRDDDYYGRGHSDSYGEVPEDEWKCLECHSWNYVDDKQCHRCRRHKTTCRDSLDSTGGSSRHQSKSSENYSHDDDEKEELDEFGRSKLRPPSPPPWPPAFQSGGAAYVFDARCAMFYEAVSDFFYDPKTKLYYGNKQRVYYTHCPGETPPFKEVPSEATSADDDANTSETGTPLPAKNANGEEKKMIAINLKSKVLPGGNEQSKTTKCAKKLAKEAKKGVTVARTTKEVTANLDKWSERGKEMRGDDNTTAESKCAMVGQDPNNIPKTSSGHPICMLCRRKFPSLDKLRQHEELSALHKQNIEKKKAADAKAIKETDSSVAYRDRALERRVLHGPETTVLPALPLDPQVTGVETEIVRPEDNLGSNNIGNQMLQKLGWKSGASLGRKADDAPTTEASSSSDDRNIVKDWERIESLAASGQGSRSQSGKGGAGIGRQY